MTYATLVCSPSEVFHPDLLAQFLNLLVGLTSNLVDKVWIASFALSERMFLMRRVLIALDDLILLRRSSELSILKDWPWISFACAPEQHDSVLSNQVLDEVPLLLLEEMPAFVGEVREFRQLLTVVLELLVLRHRLITRMVPSCISVNVPKDWRRLRSSFSAACLLVPP